MEYIDVHIRDGKYLGRLLLKDGKIEIEAISEIQKEMFEEDLQLWRKQGERRGLKGDKAIFHMIPIMASNWSRIILSEVKKEEE